MTKQFLTIVAAAALSIQAFATPTYDTFGPLPEATFGGSGIHDDEVAVGMNTTLPSSRATWTQGSPPRSLRSMSRWSPSRQV